MITTQRRVITTQRRVFTTQRRVITTQRRVITTQRRVITTQRRVITTQRRVITTQRRVITTQRRVITTQRRVIHHSTTSVHHSTTSDHHSTTSDSTTQRTSPHHPTLTCKRYWGTCKTFGASRLLASFGLPFPFPFSPVSPFPSSLTCFTGTARVSPAERAPAFPTLLPLVPGFALAAGETSAVPVNLWEEKAFQTRLSTATRSRRWF